MAHQRACFLSPSSRPSPLPCPALKRLFFSLARCDRAQACGQLGFKRHAGMRRCEIIFDKAIGFLLGEPNKGMQQMFTFINTSRLGTAMMGVALAELSWQKSLCYASERRAMRSLSGMAASWPWPLQRYPT